MVIFCGEMQFFIQTNLMIYIHPHSGLANRIRVIISGINLAKKRNEQAVILWSKDESLFAEFNCIFETNEVFKIINVTKYKRIIGLIRRVRILKKFFFIFFRISNYIQDSDIPKYVWSTGTNNIDFRFLSNCSKNTYIYTCHEFLFDTNLLNVLQPTKLIKDAIEENISLFSRNTIGIHIRRADHKEAIENSPLNLFVSVIETELLKNFDSTFFLATDDVDTEILLKNKFGNKILTNKKVFSRITEEGIKGAVIDLYCLSATKKIYGSFYSSFSDIASRIGNIPLEILKKD